ncbi:MAG: D-alanyl-D-alanine carboxypeptidase/D-alanyl-D-alanine-endopeptidase [Burkholderiaceae bacterium]|nr:D-alanyl-D-alanine carboxypeptidase/D-alanyl-D-alanine-endopeptidase [Burkholderiaceae bacterium]
MRPCRPSSGFATLLLSALLSALLLSGCAGLRPAQPGPVLPPDMAAALRQAGVPPDAVAVDARPADGGAPLLAWNAGSALQPASVMKLFTVQAALELLGPGHRWITRVQATGVQEGDVLQGDLIIEGGGDPRFAHEDLWQLLSRLRALGLREIRGDLVLDRSLFDAPAADAAAFDGRPDRAYNAPPDALLLDAKALHLRLLPEGAGRPARIAIRPPLAGFVVEPPLAADGPCENLREQLQPQWTTAGLRFAGAYPLACGERELSFHLHTLDAAAYFDAVFRSLWAQLGGVLAGGTVSGRAPADSRDIAHWTSAPLSEQIRDINKHSNNPMARNLLLSMAAGRGGAPATAEAAAVKVGAWLHAAGIDASTLVIDNGSGLSRRERSSAAALAALLQHAWRQPTMPEFVASLPVAGIDGTMARRFADSPLRGRAHIKTGSLADVASIAGYVTAASGRRIAVVALINHPKANEARAAFDRLLAWVYASY